MNSKVKKLAITALSVSFVAAATFGILPLAVPNAFNGMGTTVVAESAEVTTVTTYDGLVAALANGGDIKLGANVTANITINEGVKVNLDLSGYTLYGQIVNSGELTLSNGSVVCTDTTLNNGAAILNKAGSVTTTANLAGAFQCVRMNGGEVIVNGGELQTMGEATCSIFRVKDGALTINDGEFKCNSANRDANKIAATGDGNTTTPTVEINGGNFYDFHVGYSDGVPFDTSEGGTLKIKGGTYAYLSGDGRAEALLEYIGSRAVEGYESNIAFTVDTLSELTYCLNNSAYTTKLSADITYSGVYNDGETIKIGSSTEKPTVNAVLDLNGYTLGQTTYTSGGLSAAAIAVYENTTLTVKDTSEAQTGKISACNRAFQLEGNLILESGAIAIGETYSGADIDPNIGMAYGVWMYMRSEEAKAPTFTMTGGSIVISDEMLEAHSEYDFANAVACGGGLPGVDDLYDAVTITITGGTLNSNLVVSENATVNVPETVEVTRLAEDGTVIEDAVVKPTGTLSAAYTSDSTYWGECGGSAKESFEFKLYNDETYMGYTALNNIGGIINGDVYVSWHIKLDAASNTDEYWTMAWEIAPTVAMQPNRVEQWVDGVKVAECAIQPNWSDSIFPVVAAVTDEDGKILSYVNNREEATLQNAVGNGGNIVLLKDIELAETVTVSADTAVTLDLNGYNITVGYKENTTNHIYALDNKGTLTLKDSVGTGSITARGNYNYGMLTVESGTYVGQDDNGGAPIFNYGTVELNGGTFNGNAYSLNNNQPGAEMTINNATVKGNGGIYNNGATLTIKDGSFEATGGYHNLYMKDSNVTIEGGTFHHSGTTSNVYPAGTTELTIKGGEFTVADGYYVIDATDAPTMNIEGGQIKGMARFNAGLNTTISGGTLDFYSGTYLSTNASMSIVGGTFAAGNAKTFAEKYLAEGFVVIENEDGAYGVYSALGRIGTIRNIATTNANGEDRYQMVFLCGIDSLNYKSVGFEVTVAGVTKTLETSTVYTGYIAAGEEYAPTAFGAASTYIFAIAINFPTELASEAVTVCAFYEDKEGNLVYGETNTWDYIYNK